jgi:hypothetical protein
VKDKAEKGEESKEEEKGEQIRTSKSERIGASRTKQKGIKNPRTAKHTHTHTHTQNTKHKAPPQNIVSDTELT